MEKLFISLSTLVGLTLFFSYVVVTEARLANIEARQEVQRIRAEEIERFLGIYRARQ